MTEDDDDSLSSISADYNSDEDPAYVANCGFTHCTQEVFSSCHCCLILLYWDHFQEEVLNCKHHGKSFLTLHITNE